MIRGYLGYYGPVIDYPTDLNYLVYLLRFSCSRTIARKLQITIKALVSKYGKEFVFKYSIKNKTDPDKSVYLTKRLLSWKDCLEILNARIRAIREKRKKRNLLSIPAALEQSVDNISNVKVNWRTSYKLSKHCCICGSTDQVQYHHVKHVRKGKTIGFTQVMNQLNRKQIPVCKACHLKIARGFAAGGASRRIRWKKTYGSI